LIVDALMCPYRIGERVRVKKLLRSVTKGMLLMWDRGLHSYAMVRATMRPEVWNPPIELSVKEEKIVKRIRKAKLFVFLRQIRHELFDFEFQEELATVLKDSTVGLSPVPPAQLALAVILQAYTGVSDDEAIEAIEMDRRWQLVLEFPKAD
jgi:Transposase domain (DUF772)